MYSKGNNGFLSEIWKNERKDDLPYGIISLVMYHKIACWIVKKLQCTNSELNNLDVQEICTYGIEITISTIVNYALLLIIGIVFKSIISAIIFGGMFTIIRHYIGGYHCTTYLRCNLTFSCIFISVLLLGKLLLNWMNICIIILILLWCGLGIWYLGPVENAHKPVTSEQLHRCHVIAMYIYILYFVISILFYLWKPYYGIVAALSLLSVVILLPIGTVAERRRKHESEKENGSEDDSICYDRCP